MILKGGINRGDMHSNKVAKVSEELAGEVSSLALNLAAVIYMAIAASLEDVLHTPVLANAVIDTGEAVSGAQIEESGELVFDLGPGKLLDYAVVHNEELLLLAIRWTYRAGKARRGLGHHQ